MKEEYRIGIDLGGTNLKVGVVDENDAILAKKSARTGAERPWQEVVADMAALVNELLADLSLSIDQCQKLGIGSPGFVDHIGGVVVFAGNFGWDYVPLVEALQQHFALPIRLANDANCAVLGEVVAGAAKGAKDVVLLTLGTGVGGGVVAGGVLQEGGSAGGMEIGHMLLSMDGEECTCGRKGCFEAYASARALSRQARNMACQHPESKMVELCGGDLSKMNGIIPFKAARMGDAPAQAVVDDYIRYLGEGIVDCINIWRPQKVLIGGGISNEGAPLIVPLNAYVRERCFAGSRGYVAPIEVATLGNDAGLIGAAAL